MQGIESSRSLRSKFIPRGNALGLLVVVITQRIPRRKSRLGGLSSAADVAHCCSKGNVASNARVSTGCGSNKPNQDTPIGIPEAECHHGASISHSGGAGGGVRANLPRRLKCRHQFTKRGFAKRRENASYSFRLVETFTPCAGAPCPAPTVLAARAQWAFGKDQENVIFGLQRNLEFTGSTERTKVRESSRQGIIGLTPNKYFIGRNAF